MSFVVADNIHINLKRLNAVLLIIQRCQRHRLLAGSTVWWFSFLAAFLLLCYISFAFLLYFCFVAFVCFLGSCVCVYQRHRLLAGAGGLTEFDCSGATGQQWMLRVLCRETRKYKRHWGVNLICHRHCIAQCAVWAVCLPRNRTSWGISWDLCFDIPFNIYLSRPSLFDCKVNTFFFHFCEFQTLNLQFPML